MDNKDFDYVIHLQRIIRGSLTRKRICQQISYELEKNVICKNIVLLRQGLILFNGQFADEDAILLFSRQFAQSMKSTSISQSYASLFLSTRQFSSSCKLINQLVVFILQTISKSDISKMAQSRKVFTLSSSLYILLTCSEENWPILKGKKEVVQILDKLVVNMLTPMATKRNIQMLAQTITLGLRDTRQSQSEKIIQQIFLVTIKFLQIASYEKDEIYQMFVELLEIPTLTLFLSNDILDLVEKSNLFEDSVRWFVQNADISTLSTSTSINLLANLIYMGSRCKKTLQTCILDWACLVNLLLEHCSRKASDKNKSNCWHHPLLGWTSERIDNSSQWTFPRLHKQISSLWSLEMVQYLFNDFFVFNGASHQHCGQADERRRTSKSLGIATNSLENAASAGMLQKFVEKITTRSSKQQLDKMGNIQATPLPPLSLPIILCQLYRNALFAFHGSRIEILSNLSRDDSLILIKLWHYIDSGLSLGGNGLQTYLGYLLNHPGNVNAPQFAPLQLFGDITHTLVSILDEQEMYQNEKPFAKEELQKISSFANRFCFNLIWDSLIDFEQKKPAQLFQSIYQLLSILYNRDCRRPFSIDPNFWIIQELSPKTFLSEFEQSVPTKRAQQLMEKMPHVIPLKERISLFRKLINQDRENSHQPTTIITVERARLIEDGYRQLGGLTGQALSGTIRVKFINQQGLDEPGIDQDGVFKEFLELTLKQVFAPELNLFKFSYDKLLYPSSTSNIQENHLELFNFVGRMLGKAVYEGICVDIQLAPVLLAAVLDRQLCPFDELASLDPVLYKNLTFLKHYSGDVEDLALTFSFQEEFLGKIYTHELIAGGRDLKVNSENKISYLHLMAHYRVVKQIREQTRSFVNGFRSIIKEKWLSLFSTHELQYLISGQLSDIYLEDLRKHVQYYGGLHSNHRLIRWLWSILDEDFTSEERRLFLKFVTSCSRPPLLGFAFLEPPFSIRCVETSDDLDQGDTLASVIRGFLAINRRKQSINERLPSTSTCFNLLKLPNYTKRSILLAKLRYAIHAETGFELS